MKGKMRALRLFAPGDVRCVETDAPQIDQPNQLIVKVKACGICGSDIMRVMEKGAYRYPITVGHEFSGEVVEVGASVTRARVGDRVTVMPLIPCGKCDYCRIGEYVLCDDYQYYGSRIDGALAEYIRVHNDNVLPVPDGVDWEAAAMTDPVSVALHAARKVEGVPGRTAAVFGLGAIGFLTVQWLKIAGFSRVYVVDIFDDKIALACKLGADAGVNAKKEDAVKWLLGRTGGCGADAVIELAGNKVTQAQSIAAARKMGTVVLCGISYDDLVIPNAALSRILRGELILKGAWNSSIAPLPVNEWRTSLDFMASGRIAAEPLISHRFRLEEGQRCFEIMYRRTETFTKMMFLPEQK